MANSLQDETRKQVYDACMQQRDKSQAFLDEEKRSGNLCNHNFGPFICIIMASMDLGNL